MIRDIKIPIEYYGIDEECDGKKFILEKELSTLDYKIEEIIRVYGEIENTITIKGKDIIGNKVIYILSNLLLTIEYVKNYKASDLSVISYNIPIYYSLNENELSTDINIGICSLYVNNYNEGKIYIYAKIIVY